jgi:hypothetical protein
MWWHVPAAYQFPKGLILLRRISGLMAIIRPVMDTTTGHSQPDEALYLVLLHKIVASAIYKLQLQPFGRLQHPQRRIVSEAPEISVGDPLYFGPSSFFGHAAHKCVIGSPGIIFF